MDNDNMPKLRLGKWNKLEVVKEVDFGMYLGAGELGEILLPKRYVPEGCKIGDVIDVFLYLDSEERLVATTETPLVEVNQFAYLEVKWVNEYGAFLDWGLMKDLFCPFREQRRKMEVGRSYIVYVYIDSQTYRIVASAKVDKFLSDDYPPYKPGEIVDVLIQQKTDLGFKAIVDNKFGGLIYKNELFMDIHTGDRLKAYVKNVREDRKIDLVMQTHGRRHVVDFSDELLNYLKCTDSGFAPYHDKSQAEDIYAEFKVSKKTFKKAVGDLYKRHYIKILDNGIELTDEGRCAGQED